MTLTNESLLNRFLKAFKTEKSKECINLSNQCKSVIYRFKNAYRIEVVSKHETNDNYFKPFKK
jgi:hypothetical protein